MQTAIPTGRSLVPVQATAPRATGTRRASPLAGFFAAQLLAVRLHAPVARRLRRAEPADAMRSYAAAAQTGAPRQSIGWTA
jgi:hypothetical protein